MSVHAAGECTALLYHICMNTNFVNCSVLEDRPFTRLCPKHALEIQKEGYTVLAALPPTALLAYSHTLLDTHPKHTCAATLRTTQPITFQHINRSTQAHKFRTVFTGHASSLTDSGACVCEKQ